MAIAVSRNSVMAPHRPQRRPPAATPLPCDRLAPTKLVRSKIPQNRAAASHPPAKFNLSRASVPTRLEVLVESTYSSLQGTHHAKAQARKERSGSFGPRPRLHGHELLLRPAQRQAGDDLSSPCRRRTRHHVLRHRRGLRPVPERRACRRSPRPLPRASGHRHQVRVRSESRFRSPRDEGRAGPEQPARAHQAGRRGLAQAAQGR